MATWTGTELRNAVLRRLGITGAGQSPAAEDASVVDGAWMSIYPQLRRKGLAPWASDAISEEAQEPLTKYVAAEVAPQFGLTGQRLAEVRQEGLGGHRQLEEQYAGDRTALTIRPRYF